MPREMIDDFKGICFVVDVEGKCFNTLYIF